MRQNVGNDQVGEVCWEWGKIEGDVWVAPWEVAVAHGGLLIQLYKRCGPLTSVQDRIEG